MNERFCPDCRTPIFWAIDQAGESIAVERQLSIDGELFVVGDDGQHRLLPGRAYRPHVCDKQQRFQDSDAELHKALGRAALEAEHAPKNASRHRSWWALQVLARRLRKLGVTGVPNRT